MIETGQVRFAADSFRAENFDRTRSRLPARVSVADFIAMMAALAVFAAFVAVWNAAAGELSVRAQTALPISSIARKTCANPPSPRAASSDRR